jgi:hypothetical protein
MRKLTPFLLAALLAFLPSVPILAAESPKKPVPLSRGQLKQQALQKYDANGNGKLDKAEMEKLARERLLRWDKNKDGKLDEKEWKVLRADSVQMPVKAKPGPKK